MTTIDEKLDTILAEVRVLQTKVQFLESDIAELKDTQIEYILQGLGTLIAARLEEIQKQEASTYKVERM